MPPQGSAKSPGAVSLDSSVDWLHRMSERWWCCARLRTLAQHPKESRPGGARRFLRLFIDRIRERRSAGSTSS
jgi:hypothetical protein